MKYGYSNGAAMGRFKHLSRGIKMDRTTEDVATPVPPEIMKHYKNIHLDIVLLFVNKVPSLLAKSIDIAFINCKALLTKYDKQVQNGLRLIILDYQSRGFNITSAFGNGAFQPLVIKMRQDLEVDLTTYAADSYMQRAETAIRFVKERVRFIQSETPFTKFPYRLTIEMVKHVTVLINLFRRKS